MSGIVAPIRRLWLALPVLAILVSCAGAAPSSAAAACSNEARRTEQGANATSLPECRAWELVAPELSQANKPSLAAEQGGAITYYSPHPLLEAETSSYFYRAQRNEAGWSNESVGPQDLGGVGFGSECEPNVFFSADLLANVLEVGGEATAQGRLGETFRCKGPKVLVAGEPEHTRNVLLHNITDGSYQLANLTPAGTIPAGARFEDGSKDLGTIVFGEEAQLTPDAPTGFDFYVWSEGTLRLLTYLPDGTPATGELVEAFPRGEGAGQIRSSGYAPATGAISDDGSRAFFYSGGSLYLRQNGDQPQSAVVGGICTEPEKACTVQIDASHGSGASGGGIFWRATPDGSEVFFTDDSRLTPDSTAESGKSDLYRFDAESGQLTDLTPHPGEAAGVSGVAALGADGKDVYFAANAVLAGGATPGNCSVINTRTTRCNLYALIDGNFRFLGSFSGNESAIWGGPIGESTPASPIARSGMSAMASPNGRYLAFVSREQLTGFDNTDPDPFTEKNPELFVYDSAADGGAGSLECASCPPGPPREPSLKLATVGAYGSGVGWMTHSVLDDGSVFFDDKLPLLPTDRNEDEDVYRFRDGQLQLISPGDAEANAHFYDASPSGQDVFIGTSQQLVGRDRGEESFSLYDAREGGGFAEPEPAPEPCEGEACRIGSTPTPPALEPAPPSEPPPARVCSKGRKKGRHGCHRKHRRHRHKHRGKRHDSRRHRGRAGK